MAAFAGLGCRCLAAPACVEAERETQSRKSLTPKASQENPSLWVYIYMF